MGFSVEPGEVQFYENLGLYATANENRQNVRNQKDQTLQAIVKALNLHLNMQQTNAENLAA